jgi:hypothetical protein
LPHLGSSCVTHAFDCSNHHCLFASLLLTTLILAITIWSCCSHLFHMLLSSTFFHLLLCLHMLLHQQWQFTQAPSVPTCFSTYLFLCCVLFEFAFLPSTRPLHPLTNSPLCKCGSLKFKTHDLQ